MTPVLRHIGIPTVSGTAVLVVAAAADWSPAVLILATITAVSGVLLLTLIRGEARSGALPEPAPAPRVLASAPPSYENHRLTETALPSSASGYDFVFSATVRWCADGEPEHSGAQTRTRGIAAASVLQRAQRITRTQEPGCAGVVRYLLEAELGVPVRDPASPVTAFATDVTVTLAPADAERLEQLAGMRKADGQWRERQRYESTRRAYLGDDVFTSPGNALAWWLSNHEDSIEMAVDMIGPLARLSAAVNNKEVDPVFRPYVAPAEGDALPPGTGDLDRTPPAGVLREDRWRSDGAVLGLRPDVTGAASAADNPAAWVTGLMADLGLPVGSDERKVLVHRIARSVMAAGRPEAALRIEENLTVPDEDESVPLQEVPQPPPYPGSLAEPRPTAPPAVAGVPDGPASPIAEEL